ncbi:MAG: hypothetical protein AABW57_02495 [Nanoarchaeota archaeon]
MDKRAKITLIIIIAVILIAIYIKYPRPPETTEEISKCIGKNSILYIQLGCSACKTQENLFGENYQYLNKVDCFYEQEKCIQEEIEATPTWIIKGVKYKGVKNIETLRELTGC